MEKVFFALMVKGLAVAKPFNAKTDWKKLACVATSSAKQAKIKIITASTFSCGTGLFFIFLLYIFDVWLAEGSPPSLLLAQALWLRSQGLFYWRHILSHC